MSDERQASRYAKKIAADVYPTGAMLKCESCHVARPATTEDCARYLSTGWPTHCGRTMRADPDAAMNQCDGCRRGLPIRNGCHYNPDGSYDLIGCTADRYPSSSPLAPTQEGA